VANTGEFVEGKEKLKIIVDKTYDGHRELHSTLFHVDPSDEEDSHNDDDDLDFGDDLQFDTDLAHDIEELGEEERRMLQSLENDADESDNLVPVADPTATADPDVKVKANVSNIVEEGLGKSEEDAILLSDDDDEDAAVESTAKPAGNVSNTTIEKSAENTKNTLVHTSTAYNPAFQSEDIFDGCRLYRICFCETKLGLEVILVNGRIVVSSIRPERMARLGPNSKPGVGDILCGIKGHTVGLVNDLHATLQFLKRILMRPPIEFSFIEAPKFIALFNSDSSQVKREQKKKLFHSGVHQNPMVPLITASSNPGTINMAQHQQESQPASQQVPTAHNSIPDIIELSDDE
jgi:hypothetical protein